MWQIVYHCLFVSERVTTEPPPTGIVILNSGVTYLLNCYNINVVSHVFCENVRQVVTAIEHAMHV